MPMQSFPARFDILDDIREFVGQIARAGGFTEREVYSLQLAADEAATNIIEHAYAGVQEGRIGVDCEFRNDTFVVVMRDTGRAFDPASVRPPNIKGDLSQRKIGGLGLYLMRKLMDQVSYESSGGGNTLTMIKRRG
jgi:anti-sigma regulatory factor (Ser/Thr protein kinase)